MRRRQLLAGLGATSAAPAAQALSLIDAWNFLFSDAPTADSYPWNFHGRFNIPTWGNRYVPVIDDCPPIYVPGLGDGTGVAYLFNSHLPEADIPIELEKDLRLVGVDSGTELLLRRSDEYCLAPEGYPGFFGYRAWNNIQGYRAGTHANWGGWLGLHGNRQFIQLFIPGPADDGWIKNEDAELTFV